ncbi:hypothetical protein LIA77_01663 [Sarocladium implicatum]|nr:hypothetical protein LIA77_01663 [Sarocladium implicatum]
MTPLRHDGPPIRKQQYLGTAKSVIPQEGHMSVHPLWLWTCVRRRERSKKRQPGTERLDAGVHTWSDIVQGGLEAGEHASSPSKGIRGWVRLSTAMPFCRDMATAQLMTSARQAGFFRVFVRQ